MGTGDSPTSEVQEAFRERLIARLFDADEALWCVLDAARDERVLPALRRTVGTAGCLYAGRLAPEIEAVAPYLVALRRDEGLLRFVLDAGWGENWGVFFSAPGQPFDAVRRHLRRFLKVAAWDGRRLLFRYYDPRVLRTFLPTCASAEAATFFGPIERFALESGDGSAVLAFERAVETGAAQVVAARELGLGARPSRALAGAADVRRYVGGAKS